MKDEENPYVIVRTRSAGVFAGYLINRKESEVSLKDARRIWYWSGAATLSQLAMEGTKHPEKCKFPCTVDRLDVFETIEILYCTDISRKIIEKVPVWSA